MFLCIAGIALYSIPVGALFDAFGAVIGLAEEEEGEDTSEEEWCSGVETGGDQAQQMKMLCKSLMCSWGVLQQIFFRYVIALQKFDDGLCCRLSKCCLLSVKYQFFHLYLDQHAE